MENGEDGDGNKSVKMELERAAMWMMVSSRKGTAKVRVAGTGGPGLDLGWFRSRSTFISLSTNG